MSWWDLLPSLEPDPPEDPPEDPRLASFAYLVEDLGRVASPQMPALETPVKARLREPLVTPVKAFGMERRRGVDHCRHMRASRTKRSLEEALDNKDKENQPLQGVVFL